MMISRSFYGVFAVVACTFPLLILGCSSAQQARPEPPPAEVIVDQSITQDVQLYIRTQGETRASQFVTIPARVAGFLQEIKFQPGDLVQEGQPLFQIEPDDYQAALEALEAELKINQAKEMLARANFERAETLIKDRTITPQEFQTYAASLQEALGNIDRTKAAITRAKLNLGYTRISSPLTGKTGPNMVDLGNLVGPGSTLITVAKMDPIHVYFDISDAQFNAIQRNAKKVGKADSQSVSPEGQGFSGTFSIAFITGPDVSADDGFHHEGTLQLTDNTLDVSTGTIIMRGEVPNPDYRIFPEQICRVRIPTELIPNAVLVREEALNSDLNTKFLLVVKKVGEDYIVHRRNIKIGEQVNGRMRVILAGLKPGETYIYRGLQKAKIDGKVIPLTQEEYDKKYNLSVNGNGKNVAPTEEAIEIDPL
ncbi:MAG: efflux RND transporter periplasmic adaptor subunit [Planctomycetaceae bacterium]|nr:efflux RND transporter periplasmic adaptor subunit [Planctomycetaceae bacterium]